MRYARVNTQFDDLPVLQIPAGMTDEDRVFHSDVTYLRDLLGDLWEQAYTLGRARDIPPPWSEQLAAAIHEVKVLGQRVREMTRG